MLNNWTLETETVYAKFLAELIDNFYLTGCSSVHALGGRQNPSKGG